MRRSLHRQMKKAARSLEFERAKELRDSLQALDMLQKSQAVVSFQRQNTDALSLAGDKRGALMEMFYMRQGRITGNRRWLLKGEAPGEEALLSFLNQYYEENVIPDEALIDFDLQKSAVRLLEQAFSEKKGGRFRVFAKSNHSSPLLKMARENAESRFPQEIANVESVEAALLEIQKKFRLPKLPLYMECFDISHWQGKASVASRVVFQNGEPFKKAYRRYHLKTLSSADDFKALREVLERRLLRGGGEKPDLILIDGGRGQLHAVWKTLKKLNLTDVPLAALAKDRVKKKLSGLNPKSSGERFYLPGRKNPAAFSSSSKGFHILLHLRDEAHRFALRFHRQKRDKDFFKSNDHKAF